MWNVSFFEPMTLAASLAGALVHAAHGFTPQEGLIDAIHESSATLIEQLQAAWRGGRAGEAEEARVRLARLCDAIDAAAGQREEAALRTERWWVLASLLRADRQGYLESVAALGGRIPREELPNAQGVPLGLVENPLMSTAGVAASNVEANEDGLVADCLLQNTTFADTWLGVWASSPARWLFTNGLGT